MNDVILAINHFDARGECFNLILSKLKDAEDVLCIRFARPIIDASVIDGLQRATAAAKTAQFNRAARPKSRKPLALEAPVKAGRMNDDFPKGIIEL